MLRQRYAPQLLPGPLTLREQGEGGPPALKTDRGRVTDADPIGIVLTKDGQEGEVVNRPGFVGGS